MSWAEEDASIFTSISRFGAATQPLYETRRSATESRNANCVLDRPLVDFYDYAGLRGQFHSEYRQK